MEMQVFHERIEIVITLQKVVYAPDTASRDHRIYGLTDRDTALPEFAVVLRGMDCYLQATDLDDIQRCLEPLIRLQWVTIQRRTV